MNQKELYLIACERYEKLQNEPRFKELTNTSQKLFAIAYIQCASDISQTKNEALFVFDKVGNF